MDNNNYYPKNQSVLIENEVRNNIDEIERIFNDSSFVFNYKNVILLNKEISSSANEFKEFTPIESLLFADKINTSTFLIKQVREKLIIINSTLFESLIDQSIVSGDQNIKVFFITIFERYIKDLSDSAKWVKDNLSIKAISNQDANLHISNIDALLDLVNNKYIFSSSNPEIIRQSEKSNNQLNAIRNLLNNEIEELYVEFNSLLEELEKSKIFTNQ